MPDNLSIFGIEISQPAICFNQSQRAELYHGLLHWFAATNKVQVRNLEVLSVAFKKCLYNLAMQVEFKIVGHNLIACATGEAGDTLKQIKFGTLWFSAWDNVDLRMFALADEDNFVPMTTKLVKGVPETQ